MNGCHVRDDAALNKAPAGPFQYWQLSLMIGGDERLGEGVGKEHTSDYPFPVSLARTGAAP